MFGPSIELIDCQSLYNLLNEGIEHSLLNDPYYLYLLGFNLIFKIKCFLSRLICLI